MRGVKILQAIRQLERRSLRSRTPVTFQRWRSTNTEHKWSTPLAKQLANAITTTGPIPVASFMRQCLTSDLGGYYTPTATPENDQFGVKGDFVTSPEISQIFGELIGIWFVAEWIAQGKISRGIYLMEVGPGRGTLMDDVLRTIRRFPAFTAAIEGIYLVEASKNLRQVQHGVLCGENTLERNDLGFESRSKHIDGLKITWTEDIRFVPKEADKTPFIIAHEFFDALPIHIFQSISSKGDRAKDLNTPTGPIRVLEEPEQHNQWRELLVSPKAPHRLQADEPEFELSLAKSSTPHSMYLPETSPRYQALKEFDGAIMEISPESQVYAREFAVRVGGSNSPTGAERPKHSPNARLSQLKGSDVPLIKEKPSGAVLIIDYGPADKVPANSLRGIRAHSRISPFASAGVVDVSADVDFLAIAETAIKSSPGVEVHGPVDQARFLTAMGMQERAAQLVKNAVDKERGGLTGVDKSELTEIVQRVESGWKRLVDRSPQGMGSLYQVMALIPHLPRSTAQPKRRPVGFGGDVMT